MLLQRSLRQYLMLATLLPPQEPSSISSSIINYYWLTKMNYSPPQERVIHKECQKTQFLKRVYNLTPGVRFLKKGYTIENALRVYSYQYCKIPSHIHHVLYQVLDSTRLLVLVPSTNLTVSALGTVLLDMSVGYWVL
jgi:hypothetical protein